MSRLEELKGRIEAREARIGVIGLGYVGLPLAVEFAKAGFTVVGFDVDGEKIRALDAGESYIEDVPAKDVKEQKKAGRLSATADFSELSSTDIINICVPTPLTRTKDPDVSHMAKAIEDIARRLRSGQLVVLGSTTYPGTTSELLIPMLEGSGLTIGKDFSVAFAPERIDPGNTKFGVHDVPKVVGGETPICTELACQIYGTIFDQVVPVSSTACAEMVKLHENTFRAINIGLANEVALMCDKLGLDVWEVMDAAATKPYGFMKFVPGPGLGGHCIPVDPSYLSWKMKSLNFSARFIELAIDVNTGMPEHVATKVGELLNEDRLPVNGSRILILGLAYKPDVGDVRESPAIDVIEALQAKGADISFHDPHVSEVTIGEHTYKNVELTDEVLTGCDIAVVVTDHSAIDWERVVAKAPRVYDTRNATKNVREGRERIRKL
ncbi:MAG: nucleotide sugar dehydrogenase [Deltaproteobacteria bacterium]|nr:nucleotide sugar dehydrogenase [Deltaproteobacteria bacterium]